MANEQVQFQFLNASSPAVQFDLTGPSGFTGGFSDKNGSSGLITLNQSGTYVVTAHMTGFQTGAYAFQLNETSQTPLTLGKQYQGTLAASGQAQLFTVTLTNPGALSVVLTDGNASDENEVYVSLGTAPTRDTYQYRFTGTGANQTLALSAQPGTYYILVYNNLVNTPGSNYTLLAQGDPFVLTGVTPGKIGTGQDETLIVSGVFPQAYQSSPAYQIQFVTAGGTVYPNPASQLYLSPTSLGLSAPGSTNANGTMTMSATLKANTLPAGTYSVRVTDGASHTQTLSNALTVTAGGTGVLQTSISAPNPIGNHEPAIIYVKYSNVGTAPMAAPLLVLTATRNGQQGAFLSLDPSLAGLGYGTNTTPAGFSPTVQFLAGGAVPGILEPGESVTVPVYYAGWLTSQWGPPIIFSVGELDTTNTQTIDWSSIQAGLRPGSINQTAWNAMYPTLTAPLGSTWGQYVQTLDNDAAYLAGIGEPTTDLSQLLSFEIEKANAAYTAQTLTSVTADDLPAPGMDLTFVQSFQQSISGRYTSGILGYGWTTNWDISATTMTNGDVVIDERRRFALLQLAAQRQLRARGRRQGTSLTAGTAAAITSSSSRTARSTSSTPTVLWTTCRTPTATSITAGYNAAGPARLADRFQRRIPRPDLQRQGHLHQLTDSNGQTETYGYDPTGQFLTSYTDIYGTTQYTYVTGQSAAQDNALAEIAYAEQHRTLFRLRFPGPAHRPAPRRRHSEDETVYLPQSRRLRHHRRQRQHRPRFTSTSSAPPPRPSTPWATSPGTTTTAT